MLIEPYPFGNGNLFIDGFTEDCDYFHVVMGKESDLLPMDYVDEDIVKDVYNTFKKIF